MAHIRSRTINRSAPLPMAFGRRLFPEQSERTVYIHDRPFLPKYRHNLKRAGRSLLTRERDAKRPQDRPLVAAANFLKKGLFQALRGKIRLRRALEYPPRKAERLGRALIGHLFP